MELSTDLPSGLATVSLMQFIGKQQLLNPNNMNLALVSVDFTCALKTILLSQASLCQCPFSTIYHAMMSDKSQLPHADSGHLLMANLMTILLIQSVVAIRLDLFVSDLSILNLLISCVPFVLKLQFQSFRSCSLQTSMLRCAVVHSKKKLWDICSCLMQPRC